MPLFGSKSEERKGQVQIKDESPPRNETLKEELSELLAAGPSKGEISRAINEAEQALTEATKADIKGIKLMEQGRCPRCSGKTEIFLYTTVCPSCGWFRRRVPDTGRCIVHLDNDEKITCDHAFQVTGHQILCVSGGVVKSQAMMRHVRHIEYVWEESELDEARTRAKRELEGVCSWCEKGLARIEEKGPIETRVAFGVFQQRYVFCSGQCFEAFRKQYPSRVHRDCYETDCADCEKCIKRYDADGYRRKAIAT